MIRSRRAISIIELLVVMSACTVVLTLTSVLIVRAMHVQMQSRAYCDAERNSLRLSDQFRRDVRQAQTAVPRRADLEGDAFLRLQFADGQKVEYSRVDGIVLRSTSVNGDHVVREEFAFPAACELSIRELESPPRLVLTITADPNFAAPADGKPPLGAVAIPVSLHAEASLGADRRFAAAGAAQEAAP